MTEAFPWDWEPVREFPGYSINRLGQVRKDSSERLLYPRFNQYDIPYVGFMKDWKQHSRSLPRLVANQFLQKPSDIFDTPIQLDGDRSNCQATNLMWRPRWYAVLYMRQFEERYDNPILAPVKATEDDEIFPDSLAAACRYGLLEREVVMSILQKTPTWPTYQQFELAEMA